MFTSIVTFLTLCAACIAIGLAWQTVKEAQDAGKILREAGSILDQSASLLADILKSASAARREEHLRGRKRDLQVLEQAFITKIRGAQIAKQAAGPSPLWVEGNIAMTVALAAFDNSEMTAARGSMNTNAPGTFLDQRPVVDGEIRAALDAVNEELLRFSRAHERSE